MGTEVLRPQDLLAERFRVSPASFHRRKNFSGNGNLTNLIVNRKSSNHTAYRKASPKQEKKKGNAAVEGKRSTAVEVRRKDDVTIGSQGMGQVTLLKRGESLDSLVSKIKEANPKPIVSCEKPMDDLLVLGTGRIGPNSPEMMPKQVRLRPSTDGYAGSAFSLSPSPRSVPLPSFFKKFHDEGKINPFDDSATRNLRRLLRLE